VIEFELFCRRRDYLPREEKGSGPAEEHGDCLSGYHCLVLSNISKRGGWDGEFEAV
jgi:hypothetical protein